MRPNFEAMIFHVSCWGKKDYLQGFKAEEKQTTVTWFTWVLTKMRKSFEYFYCSTLSNLM